MRVDTVLMSCICFGIIVLIGYYMKYNVHTYLRSIELYDLVNIIFVRKRRNPFIHEVFNYD